MSTLDQEALSIRFTDVRMLLKCRFSTLFTGLDARTRRPLVVRQLVLPRSVKHQVYEKAREQFFREGALFQQLSHRGLPKVLEVAEEGRSLYQVLAPFDGETLQHVASHLAKLPAEKLLVRWMVQMAEVLGYLHNQTQPIIYRNLRPDTVLLTAHASVLLVDFGLARLVDTAGPGQTLFRGSGDANFAPPEQFGGLPSTPDVDIYSLGATMYTLATGKVLPSGWERMMSAAPVIPLASLNPYVSQPLADLLHQMLSLEAGARPQTMDEVLSQLKRIAPEGVAAALIEPAAAPVPVAAEPPPPVEEPPTRPLVVLNEGWKLPFFGRRSVEPTEAVEPGPLDRWPLLDLSTIPLDRTVGQLIPETVAVPLDAVCIGRPTDYELLIAVSDPRVPGIREQVAENTHNRFIAVVVRAEAELIQMARHYIYGPRSDLKWLDWLQRRLGPVDTMPEVSLPQAPDEEATRVLPPLVAADDDLKRVPRVQLAADGLMVLLQAAVAQNLTDLHLESHGPEVLLRHRIDGAVRTMKRMPRQKAAGYFQEVRDMAGLSEHVPGRARVGIDLDGQAYDVRVSLVPGLHGDNVMLRWAARTVFANRLDQLGLFDSLPGWQELLQRRSGLLLAGGAKGSGTTTTLYASMRELDNGERKLMTVESPVEWEVPGTIQVLVDGRDVSWESALREVLMQDPDAVMVGEMADPRTVRLMAEAALEDHLMLSTLPVGRAMQVVSALAERGMERELVAAALSGCLVQCLVRQLCQSCKTLEVGEPSPELAGQPSYRPRGCADCRQTGYAGRLALSELLVVTPDMRGLIRDGVSDERLQKAAEAGGWRPLRAAGLARVAAGLTTLSEVNRVGR